MNTQSTKMTRPSLTTTDQQVNKPNIIRRPVSELPTRFRSVFPYIDFNQVQSLVYDAMLETDKSMVVSAPTGSGKTGIFELAMIKVIMDMERRVKDFGFPKMVYLAPTKALCGERLEDWTKKFAPFNIQCIEMTSDVSVNVNFRDQKKANIILATPEKWDSITRSWNGHKTFVQSIRLLMIDEVHLVNDGVRGATLEAVVSRMKTIRSLIWPNDPDNLRFVAVSATVCNVDDIALWFSSPQSIAEVQRVDPSQRPVKLRTIVQGFTVNRNVNEFSFDNLLNHKLGDIIKEHSCDKPTLIFCATRKSSMTAASVLAREGRFDVSFASEKRKLYAEISSMIKDKNLQELTKYGIAFHHAGLSMNDRRLIEAGFLNGRVMILCCTSTLALGVNLPAHLVIIKNTSYYDEGQFKPYSESSLVQMIGRAGRPQFDTEATAVILTKSFCRDEIEKMLSGNLIVESKLHTFLTEHLNSEIVLGTVTSDIIARKWLESTFLHQRLQKNPENYGLTKNSSSALKEKIVTNWCRESIDLLLKHKMIRRTEDDQLEPTEIGKAMARHYVSLGTMVAITSLKGDEDLWALIQKICSCQEVTNECQLRNEDRPFLNQIVNPKEEADKLRFPLGDNIKSKEKKAAALVQASFGNIQLTDNSIFQESLRVIRAAARVANCLKDVAMVTADIKYSFLASIVILGQCFAANLWEDSVYISKQLDRIGPILSRNLAVNGLTTFELIRKANPRNIEIFCNRLPPFGSNVQQTCFGLPIYHAKFSFKSIPNFQEKISLIVEVTIVNGQEMRIRNSLPSDHRCVLIIGCPSTNTILLHRYISDAGILNSPDLTACLGTDLDRWILPEEGAEIEAKIISEAYVGLDVTQVVPFMLPMDDLYG